jgi:DNA-binding IclR family transcriptional regulator
MQIERLPQTEASLQTVGRALQLLAFFGDRPGPHALTAIAAELDWNKAVCHRLLRTLAARGFVVQETPTRAYSLGPAALRLGQRGSRIDLRSLAKPVMQELALSNHLSSFLTIPLENETVCVERAETDAVLRVSYDRGRRHPYHAGAPGKVLLAHLDAARQVSILDSELARFTPRTIVARRRLGEELSRIRSRGFAISHGEMYQGVSGVAAIITDSGGQPLGALSLAGPTGMLSTRAWTQHGARLLRSAEAIAKRYEGERLSARVDQVIQHK